MGRGSSMMDSTLYTIGTALGRARDHGVSVQVLVAGQWLDGLVSAVDGHGVVLVSGHDEHAVVRMADISAVRVLRALADQAPHHAEPRAMAGMAPRSSWD